MLKNISSKLREQSEKVKGKIPVVDLSNLGVEKINESIKQLKDVLPLVKEAGYTLSEIEVEVGMPPTVIIHFQVGSGSTSLEDILSELREENKVGYSIIKGLLFASKVQESLKLKDEKLEEVEIELGIPPKVVLHFQKS
ncbi:hypothetical protein [Phorcysia thermohydrogeniphila]|uniref:Uncharacterized protein n=1 Tax=Phorcysia thermohydrogeniphila TaxID=936138 RepID=A0A4R1G7H4_9BACT|nr:hypothetical protein [Phorcysia thermohydrogeniphila]TCK02493.1 hypothetical protein CLV27_1668 [Phorcysia thermohydrogeniphila]